MEKDNLNRRAFGPFFLSLQDIKEGLLTPDLKESELISLIEDISKKFTTNREYIDEYVSEEKRVSAYTSFYFPTNVPKLHFLLSQLQDDILNDLFDRPFIDYGCGPGTFSLALDLMLRNQNREYVCVDSSKVMIAQAQKMFRHLNPKAHVTYTNRYIESSPESVLFFGHSINELGLVKTEDIILTINPKYVIFIEPGTSELFLVLKTLRENLSQNFQVLYPCLSHKECPSSWCHQVLRCSHDSSIERLSQLVSLDRKIQPLTAHVYKRRESTDCIVQNDTKKGRVIRYLNETKFSFEYEICQFENDVNINSVVEIMKKDLSKSSEKYFKNASVGELIEFKVIKDFENKKRIKVIENLLGNFQSPD